MREFIVVTTPEDLLPQIVGELLDFAADPNLVEVVHGTDGREIHAHPEVAHAWYEARQKAQETTTEKAPEPTQKETAPPAPVAPRKKAASA